MLVFTVRAVSLGVLWELWLEQAEDWLSSGKGDWWELRAN